MNKKLIAVAVAAAFAAPSAFAASHGGSTTTLYGKMHMTIMNDGSADMMAVTSNASRLGVKGSEALGNGLKAIFKLEYGVNPDENNGINSGRNAYLGLQGDFGTFLIGRHDTPAKVAFYAAGNDHLGDSIADLNGAQGFAEIRIDNAIAYVSPSMSGFKAAVALVPGEKGGNTNGNASAGTADSLADAYSFGLMYSGNGLKAGLGYLNAEDYFAATDATLWNVGASYKMGDATIGVQYQNQDMGADQTDVIAVIGKYKFGSNAVIANYGKMEREIGAASTDANTFAIALQHSMSKRTSVYVAYANGDGAGLTSTFEGNIGATTSSGRTTNDSDFALGMIHNF